MIILSHANRLPVTIQYPYEKLITSERFRGRFHFEFDKCVACEVCVRVCPIDLPVVDWKLETDIRKKRLRPRKQREDVYKRDMQQQGEGKGLHRGTPEQLSDVSISMVTHYFDESFLRTEDDYGNTYSKSHLSDSIVKDKIFSEEFAMIYLIHA
ncbi:hypothetical protein R6Q57_027211 [Mikania cordata]